MTTGATRLMYQNLVRSATLTASSQVASLPVRNLLTENRQEAWRTTGVSSEWVQADFGEAKTFQALALVGSNLRASATVELAVGDSDPPITDAFVVPIWEHDADVVVLYLSTPQTFRRVRLTMQDAGHPDGYLQLGVMYVSPLLDLGKANAFVEYEEHDPSPLERADSGTAYTYALALRRRVSVPMSFLATSLVWPTVRQALRVCGTQRATVLSIKGLAPSGDDYAKTMNVYGHLTRMPNWRTHEGNWQSDAPVFEESL